MYDAYKILVVSWMNNQQHRQQPLYAYVSSENIYFEDHHNGSSSNYVALQTWKYCRS